MARILVTNDDGIGCEGIHVLARSLQRIAEVVVVAPDKEYSGAGAAIGTLHLIEPVARRVEIDGVETAWSLSGPPALCTRLAMLGGLGGPFDLVVAGINPGANTSVRTPYHSGTIGAALTARNAGLTGVAVSQDITFQSVEGQSWDGVLVDQRWETAGDVAAEIVERLLADLPAEPAVLNVNVPNRPRSGLNGYRTTTLATAPGRAMAGVTMTPLDGESDAFSIALHWGEPISPDADTDVGAVRDGWVSLTWLTRIAEASAPTQALTGLLTAR